MNKQPIPLLEMYFGYSDASISQKQICSWMCYNIGLIQDGVSTSRMLWHILRFISWKSWDKWKWVYYYSVIKECGCWSAHASLGLYLVLPQSYALVILLISIFYWNICLKERCLLWYRRDKIVELNYRDLWLVCFGLIMQWFHGSKPVDSRGIML